MKSKLINYLISISLGLIVSTFGGFLQATKIKIYFSIPIGFGIYVILVFLTIFYIRNQFKSRLNMIFYFLSWLIITLLMSIKSRAGDLVLTNNSTAIVYLLGSVIVITTAVVYPVIKIR